MKDVFINEFDYSKNIIPEYMKKWWNEKLKVSYILTSGLAVYLLIMLILHKNIIFLVLEILPVLLIVLITVKISKAIRTEKARFEVNYKGSIPLLHIEIGEDIYYRTDGKESHFAFSDMEKVLETKNLIIICFRGDLTLPLSKKGFLRGNAGECLAYLRERKNRS